MILTKYLFHVVGENPDDISRLHKETINRIKTYGLAVHIPVMTWMVAGFVIPYLVFDIGIKFSLGIALFCMCIIYLIERIIVATPKGWLVSAFRLALGVLVAVISSFAMDLILFEKEIRQELAETAQVSTALEYDSKIIKKATLVEKKKKDWLVAQAAANCEANGECGSKTRSLGPIYRALKEQSDILRDDYIEETSSYAALLEEKNTNIKMAKDKVFGESGLLNRAQALHQYVINNNAAFIIYSIFFMFVIVLELMVLSVKLAFGETVDDKIAGVNSQVDQAIADSYLKARTSPDYSQELFLLETMGMKGGV